MIHTRVPESLETELRHKAEDLGISVSNLVRNVLGHAFGLVGDVVADSHAIARAARGAGGSSSAAASPPSSASASPPWSAPASPPPSAAASPPPSAGGSSPMVSSASSSPPSSAAASSSPIASVSPTQGASASASPSAPPAAPSSASPISPLDDVLGWQAVVMGKNAVCLRCNAMLPRGSDAALGVAETTGARLVICVACLAELRT